MPENFRRCVRALGSSLTVYCTCVCDLVSCANCKLTHTVAAGISVDVMAPTTPALSLEEAQQKIQELETQLAASRALSTPQQSNAMQNVAPVVNSIYRQPKIATFCRKDPMIWFTQAKITLRNAGIVVSATKADCIAEKLDFEALQSIHDIITAEPCPADIYDQVKKRLIDTYGSSAEARLRKLIKGQVSTIGKPSLVLNRLRGLNTGSSDDVLCSVFLE